MNDMPSSQPARTGYAPVNGLKLYFEVHGPSRPDVPSLVLLHGGGDTIETSFSQILPLLARQRQVIAFEQQGCGRTADIVDRPFTFEQSAEDTTALLDYLQVDHADLFGFSNGGSIALHVAMRHPQLVRRIIAVTAVMQRNSCHPQFWESMKTATPEAMPWQLREAYIKVAPDPENFESFFYKSRNRMRDFKDVPDEAIRAIAAPTLIVGADRDVMQPEGAVALYRVLPHAQLAILPNTEHMQITSRTDWLVPMIEAFLNAPPHPGEGPELIGR
jgi:pimeloyl-ACP methyl ester carboxylesterase